MNILHVSGATSWGGNEQQLVDTIFGLDKLNVSSYIFCYKSSPLEAYALVHNLKTVTTSIKSNFSFRKIKLLKQSIIDLNIDLVHLHTSDSVTTYVVSDILVNLRVPAVFSKKGISSPKKGLSAYKYNYKNILKTICVSKAVLDSFKKTLKFKNLHKLVVVYDGIKTERAKIINSFNVRKKYNISNDVTIIGNIANHTRAKDLVTFVKTVNHLVNVLNIKNVCFIQIGKEGKYSENFLPLIEEYKLEKYIKILGFVENAFSLMPQFNIYLMSSEREGLPITIYEAFYQKTSVVSTKAGGVAEAITHNVNGLLSEIKDYKDLAKNILILIKQPKLKDAFVEKSYSLILNKFTTKQLAKNTLSVYNDILNKKAQ
jgi:glycosyltransferase involved in cell wall biosynthesis